MSLNFQIGKKYSRNTAWEVCYPGTSRPSGGSWDTGYVRLKKPNDDCLIVFMNIGIPGSTGHDFPNDYDLSNNIVTWYGKPNTHSGQPLMKELIKGELKPYFFARWITKDPEFTYIGLGSLKNFQDGVKIGSESYTAIEFKFMISDHQLLSYEEEIDLEAKLQNAIDESSKQFKEKAALVLSQLSTTDSKPRTVTSRTEQIWLRVNLFGNLKEAKCAICKKYRPVNLMVAGHIKPRYKCTIQERLDINIVMPVCKIGCDDLYEKGYVLVSNEGYIIRNNDIPATFELDQFISEIEGLKCDFHNTYTKNYFEYKKNMIEGVI